MGRRAHPARSLARTRRAASFTFAVAMLASCDRPQNAAPPPTVPTPVTTVHSDAGGVASSDPGVTLTHPTAASAAWDEELRYLEQLVDLWWAARDEHRRVDGIDVGRIFARARERARVCTQLACYAGVLSESLCALGDGHLRIQPEWWLPRKHFESGLRLRTAKDAVVVAPPAPPGLGVGDNLVSIAGVDAAAALQGICERPGSTPAQRRLNAIDSLSFESRFDETPPPARELVFTGAGGEKKTWTLRWSAPSSKDGGAPAPCISGRMLDKARAIALVHVASFWCGGDAGKFDAELHAAAEATAGAKRVVVDLRDNGGGMDGPAQHLAAALATEKLEWMRYRHARPYPDDPAAPAAFFRSYAEPSSPLTQWKKSERWFLIGPGCFSTCDTFASAFRAIEGVHFVGEATAGGVGNPTPFRLPYSGIVVDIPVTLYAMPGRSDDAPIEAHGTEPDVRVIATVEQVRAGMDPVLDAAMGRGRR